MQAPLLPQRRFHRRSQNPHFSVRLFLSEKNQRTPSVPTIPPSFPVCKSGPAKTSIFLSQSAASSADHLPVTPREDHWRRERKETSVPASGPFPIRRSSRTVPQEYAGPLSSPGKESGRRAIPGPFFYFPEKFSPPQNGEFFESQKEEHFHFSKNSP